MHGRNEGIRRVKHGIWGIKSQFVRTGERGVKDDSQFSNLKTEVTIANYGEKAAEKQLWGERGWHKFQIPFQLMVYPSRNIKMDINSLLGFQGKQVQERFHDYMH